jgi:hypothetical protein
VCLPLWLRLCRRDVENRAATRALAGGAAPQAAAVVIASVRFSFSQSRRINRNERAGRSGVSMSFPCSTCDARLRPASASPCSCHAVAEGGLVAEEAWPAIDPLRIDASIAARVSSDFVSKARRPPTSQTITGTATGSFRRRNASYVGAFRRRKHRRDQTRSIPTSHDQRQWGRRRRRPFSRWRIPCRPYTGRFCPGLLRSLCNKPRRRHAASVNFTVTIQPGCAPRQGALTRSVEQRLTASSEESRCDARHRRD